jgi:DNA-3-methyladenine glycosylase
MKKLKKLIGFIDCKRRLDRDFELNHGQEGQSLSIKTAPLPRKFYERSALQVARQLIGMHLIHKVDGLHLEGRIVETEAYLENDPACHAYKNYLRKRQGLAPVGRSLIMFGNPGLAYVYLNYGMHWLFNVVTDKPGKASAVLIRAVEPVSGLAHMKSSRPNIKRPVDLTNGPGKLAKAMGINALHNGQPLTFGSLYIKKPVDLKRKRVCRSTRIGISQGTEKPWRFFEWNNPYVSK